MEVRGDGLLKMTGNTTLRNTRVYADATLQFNGTHRGLNEIFTQANESGTIGGNGVVTVVYRFDIRSGGTLAPGASEGTLDITVEGPDGVRMYGGSTYEWELGPTGADKLEVTGDLELQDGWTLKLLGTGGTPRPAAEYDIFTYTGDIVYTNPVIDTSAVPADWDVSGLSVVHDDVGKRVYITGLYSPLGIVNDTASNRQDTSAQLNGWLSCSGTVMDAWVYWGETDDGTNAGSWSNSYYVGSFSNVTGAALAHTATGLTVNAVYSYAFRATNATYDLWAQPSASVLTWGPPAVRNDGATHIRTPMATLNGRFLGHNRGDVTVYWGRTDGGTNAGDWDHSMSIGAQSDATFAAEVTNLLFPYAYHYTFHAVNAFGDGWAASSTNFASLEPATHPVVPVTAGLELWLDGTDLDGAGDGAAGDPVVGENITRWVDKSGQTPSRDATDLQNDPAVADGPVGTRVVSFDNDDRIATTHSFTPAQYTIFGVSRYAGNSRLRVISSRDTNWILGHHGGMDERFYANGWIYAVGDNNTDWHIYAGHINNDADPKASFWKDGTLLVSNHAGSHNTNYKPQKIQLNGYNGGSELSDSEIAEVILYNRVLDSNELDRVGGYLEWKYALGTAYDPDVYTPPSAISIANTQPTDVSPASATLNATLNITSSVYDVWIYWGPADGTNNPAAWATNALVGTLTNHVGSVSYTAPITPGVTNYYTFHITNALDDVWAAPSVDVPPVVAPAINNDAGAIADLGSATLQGELTAGGFADILVYWGRSDGGTNATAWNSVVTMEDMREGAFNTDVAVGYGETYYYRSYATNAIGDAWAGYTTNFTALEPPPPGLPVTDGLIAEYKFEDNAADTSGNNAHATLVGAASYIDGRVGRAIKLNAGGSGDYVDIPILNGGAASQGITYGMWVKLNAPGANMDVLMDHDGWTAGYVHFSLANNAGLVRCDLNGQGNKNAGNAHLLSQTEWRYVFYVNNNIDHTVDYWMDSDLDGVLNNNGHWTGQANRTVINSVGRQIGSWNNGRWLKADVDEVVVYNRGITQAEAQEIYDYYLSPPPSLGIANNPVSNLTTDSATMSAELAGNGWTFDVYACWGTNDGGTVAGNWDSCVPLGSVTNHEGTLSHDLTGLSVGPDYFYTFVVTNEVTNLAAVPSETFQVLSAPTVANLAPTDVTPSAATLNGDLVLGGVADVTLYWGRSDGGTNGANWDKAIAFGTVTAQPFSNTVPVLAGGAYYYRCYATNSLGSDWADTTETFLSAPAGLSVGDAGLAEGQNGTNHMVFSVTMSDPSVSNVMVSYATADDTATAGLDYMTTGGVVSLTSGLGMRPEGDDLESYGTVTNLHGLGNWEGWNGATNSAAPLTNTVAYSGSNSVYVAGGSDTVHKYAGLNGGRLVHTAWLYVPTGSTTGRSFYGLMHAYTGQDFGAGSFIDMDADELQSEAGVSVPLIRDRWVELRTVIDLDADTCSEYYNGELLSTHAWGGEALVGLDLWANGASPVYYDDINVVGLDTQFTVPILGDRVDEYPSETFEVNLSSPVNAAIADGTGIGTIVDDDFDKSLAQWKARMKITFSGYTGSETLTNFPALVVLNEGIYDFQYIHFASPQGLDLRFSDATATRELNYEIEHWDTSGDSFVWVQVPELVDSNTFIWAYWRNPDQTNAPAYTTNGATWTEGFAGVWHMTETDAVDSTPNGRDGVAAGAPTVQTGNIGDAVNFAEGNGDEVTITGYKGITGTNARTMSAWIKTTDIDAAIMSWGTDASGQKWIFRTQSGNGPVDGNLRVEVNGGYDVGTNVVADGQWHHVVAAFPEDGTPNPEDMLFYVDGEPDPSSAVNSNVTINTASSLDVRIGQDHSNRRFNGLIDEARICPGVRSADWIRACYSNQVSGSTFAIFSNVRAPKGTMLIIR